MEVKGSACVSSLPRYCQPELTTPISDPTVSMKGLIQTRAQLCVIVLIYRTDQSLAAIPSIHSGHEDSAGTAGKGAAGNQLLVSEK